jgi:outer membrane biosynthesis protein TonB
MRYNRVQAVLEQEAAFRARMGEKTEVVLTPDGEKQLFSPEVIAVTQAIHDSGKDAHKVHKVEIIKTAVSVFKIRSNGHTATVPPPAAPAEAKAPAPAPAPDPTPAPAPTPAVSKPTQKATAKAPSVKPKATPEPTPATTKKEEPVVESTASAPKADVDTSREAALAQARETINPPRPGENMAAFNAMISIYSTVLTALQLTELFDNHPGHEKRRKTLDDLAREVNKFTSIKPSAKESQKA